MSTIVCAISGNAPEEPVFSAKTGHVYEKRLIEQLIQSGGKCPVTKEELTLDDISSMKANKAVRPRPTSAASVPGMLSCLQGEWDAFLTETYELKSHLDTTRKQLSHALYQHDAACRVIARLLRERDAARGQVATLQDQMANMRPMVQGEAQEGEKDDTEETGLTPEIITRMTDIAKTLSRTRKKREFPGLATVDEVKQLDSKGEFKMHQSTAPGILCMDMHKEDNQRIVTGGVDQQVILFDAGQEKVAQKFAGHTKKVTSVIFHSTKDVVLSASADGTARVWACTDTSNWKAPYTCASVVRKHEAEVTDLSVHPLGDFFLTSSRDKSWALHDFSNGRCVRHVRDQESGYACMKFHPDGLICAGGTENKVIQVWDIKDQVTVATLTGHEGEIAALSFSENGYYLASASKDGTVKIWDLRKPLNIQTLQVGEGAVNAVRFDQTGQYLALGAGTAEVYNWETKASVVRTVHFDDHAAPVMGVCMGSHAKSLATVSMDQTLRLYKVK